MFASGVQFGHKNRFYNPAMLPYIYETKNGMRIFDLVQTAKMFEKSLDVIGTIVAQKGQIVFVGTKPKASKFIKHYAETCQMPYVENRWLGGTLTNYSIVKRSIRTLENLELEFTTNGFEHLIKKERSKKVNVMKRLLRKIGGLKTLKGLPKALFVLDAKTEANAIKEAHALKIPVFAVVDSNSSPEGVQFVIPGNDDSQKAIKLYLSYIAQRIIKELSLSNPVSKDRLETNQDSN